MPDISAHSMKAKLRSADHRVNAGVRLVFAPDAPGVPASGPPGQIDHYLSDRTIATVSHIAQSLKNKVATYGPRCTDRHS